MQVLRKQYEKELQSPYVSVQTKFNLAWGLVKSPRREDHLEGVKLLQGVHRYFDPPVYLGSALTHGASQKYIVRNQRGDESVFITWRLATIRWGIMTMPRNSTVGLLF